MQKVSVRETRQQISRLLDAVANGEEIVIMRRGKPAARLLPPSDMKRVKVHFPDRSTLRAKIPRAKMPAGRLIRAMREDRG